jgi:hypothetical protein
MSEQDKDGMVLVPRRPTKKMLDAAYWSANDENAAGVWKSMIEAWLQQSKSGKSKIGSD